MDVLKKIFTPYALALLAKEKGFNEKCIGYFDRETKEFHWTIGGNVNHEEENTEGHDDALEYNCISAPTYEQIIDWLIENHRLSVEIEFDYPTESWRSRVQKMGKMTPEWADLFYSDKREALNKAIEEAFKLI